MQVLANTSIDATSCKYKYRCNFLQIQVSMQLLANTISMQVLANTSIDATSCKYNIDATSYKCKYRYNFLQIQY